MTEQRYSIDDLSRLTGLTVRTIRFYIQNELVDRPIGERRGAHYVAKHLESLLRIKRLTEEGRSLESIRAMLSEPAEVPRSKVKPGTVTVLSHIHLAPGVSLVIDPEESGLDAQEVRRLVTSIIELLPNK
ncbi:MAG: helix-turn-helix domain-containing protein [Sutterellaceae bacterium]|nr:helix-turn-helix domain-containing protein [Sutterellaceae bacterium]